MVNNLTDIMYNRNNIPLGIEINNSKTMYKKCMDCNTIYSCSIKASTRKRCDHCRAKHNKGRHKDNYNHTQKTRTDGDFIYC